MKEPISIGKVLVFLFLSVLLGFLILLTLLPVLIHAETSQRGEIGDWIEGLRMPYSYTSCCGIGDCRRTSARISSSGEWDAIVSNRGKGEVWATVPRDRILKTVAPDGEAYICTSSNVATDRPAIYCFVPPAMSY